VAGGPFVVGVAAERRNPGVQRRLHVAGPLPGLGTSAAAVPDDADVAADLAVEAMTDGRITATGTVRAPWTAECRRCLEPVDGELEVAVQEVFEDHPAEDAETYRLDGDHLDLEPMLRDAVLLALPLAPLCRDDCAGPAPESIPVVVGDEPVSDPPADPRWAALEQLKFD
jgi:uncharacterized protein